MANSNSQTSCFVPDPRYTFIFDAARQDIALPCVICTESHLTLPWNHAVTKDSDPSLLPCGHVFGTKCLELWLETHDTCPSCRFQLQYELCKHPIPPRRLTRRNVMFVPRTIPDGGSVGDQCANCRAETDERVASEMCVPLARMYYERRERYEETGREIDREVMEEFRACLNKAVEALGPRGDRIWSLVLLHSVPLGVA